MPLFSFAQRQKKILLRSFIIILLVPLFFLAKPPKTAAAIPVADWLNTAFHSLNSVLGGTTAGATTISAANSTIFNLKEFIGKPLAVFAARQIIRGITAQTVNWINSGFKGNPAYVTNPDDFFLNVGDTIAAKMLSENSALNKLCSPFRAQVRLALAKNYINDQQPQYACTVDRVMSNYDAFTNDFNQGGWDAWFSVTQNVQNNPYGAYMLAKNDLETQIMGQTKKYNDQLNRGNGFFSFERCKKGAARQATVNGNGILNNSTEVQCKPGKTDFTKSPPVCTEYETTTTAIDSGLGEENCAPGDKEVVTPGSVIQGQLNKVLTSPVTQLEVTNDINQIVSALMQQLFIQVVGGIKNGLRGTSESDATNGARTLIEKMAQGSPETLQENANARDTIASTTPAELTPNGPAIYVPPTDDEVDQNTNKYKDKYTPPTTNPNEILPTP
jgi:hypothetical protein